MFLELCRHATIIVTSIRSKSTLPAQKLARISNRRRMIDSVQTTVDVIEML